MTSPLQTIQWDQFGTPTLSEKWTLEERLAAVSFLVSIISDDVCAGNYSAPGRPNSVFVQYVCALPAEELEEHKVREAIAGFAEERRKNSVWIMPPEKN